MSIPTGVDDSSMIYDFIIGFILFNCNDVLYGVKVWLFG